MNLLFLHSSSDLYGASKILINVVRIVKKNGHEPIVVLSEIGPLSKLFEAENIAVYIIRLGILRKKYFSVIGIINRIKYILKAKKELIQLALDKKIDIIYSNTSVVTVGILVAKSLNLRHIFHVHEIITPKFLANIINNYLIKSSENIIAVSYAVAENIDKKWNTKHITVIHNGIDSSTFASKKSLKKDLNINNEYLVLGMIGRISQGKGQHYFIDIAIQIIKKHPFLKVILVGDTYPGNEHLEKEIDLKIKKSGLSGNFIQLGYRTDIVEILNTLDIFVFPSIQPDSFPTVILEAMACKKPIITTIRGGASEMIENNLSGFYIPFNDVHKSASIITSLLLDEKKRKSFGEVAYQKVISNFDLTSFEDKIMTLINQPHEK